MTKLSVSHYLDLVDGKFKQTSAKDLKKLFNTFNSDEHKNHLVIHFHGGLVGREAGIDVAGSLLDPYQKGGGYPVFFIWNSDIKTTLLANLKQIAKEDIFKRLVRRVARYVIAKIGETEGGKGGPLELPSWRKVPKELEDLESELNSIKAGKLTPLTDIQADQFKQELEDDNILAEQVQEIVNGLQTPESIAEQAGKKGPGAVVQSSTKTLMSPSILSEAVESQQDPEEKGIFTAAVIIKHAAEILIAVIKRYISNRDHGLYTTVVEEVLRALYIDNIGGLAWKAMKGDTEDAFRPDGSKHGGTAFLEQLKQHWRDDLRVTLIGHSTGAIFITHFLREADRVLPANAKFDVIFLAAASSFPLIHSHLDVYKKRVAKHAGADGKSIRHIRSFGLADTVESSYFEIPLIYKGSLLYLVSGLLEENEIDMPIVGMERYFSANAPYNRDDVQEVIGFLENATVWAPVDNGEGRRCQAEKHGDFDNDSDTVNSIIQILESGF